MCQPLSAYLPVPGSERVERWLLGAFLQDKLAYDQAAEHLRAEGFLWIRVAGSTQNGRPRRVLQAHKPAVRYRGAGPQRELKAVGDVGYVAELRTGVVFESSELGRYVKMLHNKWIAARSHCISPNHHRSASNQSDPAEEVLGDTEAAIFQLRRSALGAASSACRRSCASRSGRSTLCCSAGSGLLD